MEGDICLRSIVPGSCGPLHMKRESCINGSEQRIRGYRHNGGCDEVLRKVLWEVRGRDEVLREVLREPIGWLAASQLGGLSLIHI